MGVGCLGLERGWKAVNFGYLILLGRGGVWARESGICIHKRDSGILRSWRLLGNRRFEVVGLDGMQPRVRVQWSSTRHLLAESLE